MGIGCVVPLHLGNRQLQKLVTSNTCTSGLNLCTGIVSILAATIVIHLPKCKRGKHFENLGMLTTLLSKKPSKDLSTLSSKLLKFVVCARGG